ncbi:hypothetical protein P8610_16215 [Fictibacillus sp. UD]
MKHTNVAHRLPRGKQAPETEINCFFAIFHSNNPLGVKRNKKGKPLHH